MKVKLVGYDDDGESVLISNIEAGEDSIFQKVDEEVEKYVNKYEELEECEFCYSKLQNFSAKYPDKNVCQNCVDNEPDEVVNN